MKQFWHEFCIGIYMQRFQLGALFLVCAIWLVLVELVIPSDFLDAIVYCSFGWFVLGNVFVPWMEHKLQQLFD